MHEVLPKACGEQRPELNAHIVAGYDDALFATCSHLDFGTRVRTRPNACRDVDCYASSRQKHPNGPMRGKIAPKNLTNGLVKVSLMGQMSLKGIRREVDVEINEEIEYPVELGSACWAMSYRPYP